MHLSSISHESEARRDVVCKRFNNQSYKTAVSWQSVDRFSSSHITYDASTHSLFQLLFHPLENKQQQHKPHFSGINLHLPSTAVLKHNQTGGLSLSPSLVRRGSTSEQSGVCRFASVCGSLTSSPSKESRVFFIRSSIGVVVALWKMLVAISRGRSESLTGEKLEMRQTQLWEITSGGINMHAQRVLCNQWIVI